MNDRLDSSNFESLDAWSFEPRRVDKPWGYELIWALTDLYCGKKLFIKAGEALSLQFHKVKDEVIYVESGSVEFTIGALGDAVPHKAVVGPQVDRELDAVVGKRLPPRIGERADRVGADDHAGARLAPALEREAAEVANVDAAVPGEDAPARQGADVPSRP